MIGTDLEPSGTGSGFGDTVVSPFLLGWDKGKIHYNTNFAVYIPHGDFDDNRVVNTDRNFWTLDPEFGFTYLNPRTGWDLSGALGYSINFENPATQYTSGDLLHFDYAVARTLKNGLKPGIVGYVVEQVTPDSGPGAIFGSFESQVFGIGPALQWKAGEQFDNDVQILPRVGARIIWKGSVCADTAGGALIQGYRIGILYPRAPVSRRACARSRLTQKTDCEPFPGRRLWLVRGREAG